MFILSLLDIFSTKTLNWSLLDIFLFSGEQQKSINREEEDLKKTWTVTSQRTSGRSWQTIRVGCLFRWTFIFTALLNGRYLLHIIIIVIINMGPLGWWPFKHLMYAKRWKNYVYYTSKWVLWKLFTGLKVQYVNNGHFKFILQTNREQHYGQSN